MHYVEDRETRREKERLERERQEQERKEKAAANTTFVVKHRPHEDEEAEDGQPRTEIKEHQRSSEEAKEGGFIFCSSCGYQNRTGSKFCKNCGAALG